MDKLTIRLTKGDPADPTYLAEHCRMKGYPVIEESVTLEFGKAHKSEMAGLVADIKAGLLVPADQSIESLLKRLRAYLKD